MSAAQLARWRAFFAVEPFGHRTEWQRVGTIAATIVNANPFRPAGVSAITPEHFVPKVPLKKTRVEGDEDLGELAASMNAESVLGDDHG